MGTFSYATHAAFVAVDPGTGIVEVIDYVVVEDGGALINPMIVDGQIWAARRKGIGTFLFEAMPFDAHGQPLASTMLDYLLPGATEVPDIRVLHMETPSPYTEFGVKGIGEAARSGRPPQSSARSTTRCGSRRRGAATLPLTPRASSPRSRRPHSPGKGVRCEAGRFRLSPCRRSLREARPRWRSAEGRREASRRLPVPRPDAEPAARAAGGSSSTSPLSRS